MNAVQMLYATWCGVETVAVDAEITNGTQEVQAYVASSPSSTAGTGMMRDQVVYFNLSQWCM